MSKLIKGGTVVTADLTTKADVFVQHDKIVAVGPDLDHAADHILDASGCYVMPGGIDPHTHMEMPFMGTFSSDDFDTGTAAALSGGTTMLVDFCLPAPNQGLLDALQQWYQKAGKARADYSFHMAITWWGKQVFDEMPKVVAARHQHLQALHGLQGRADGERRRDVRVVLALRRARRAAAGARGERRRRRLPAAEALGRRQQRPRGARLFAPARGGGRGRQPRRHDRRPGRRAALCGARLLRAGARGDPPRPREGHARLRRALDPAPRPRRERIPEIPTGITPRGA